MSLFKPFIQSFNNFFGFFSLSLTPMDQELFNCDISKTSWVDYFELYMKGLRLYINKDPDETLPRAKLRYTRLGYAHKFVVLIYYAFIALFIYGFLKFSGLINIFSEYVPAILK